MPRERHFEQRAMALLRSPGTTPHEDREAAIVLADVALVMTRCRRDARVVLALLLQACGLLAYDAMPHPTPGTTGKPVINCERPGW